MKRSVPLLLVVLFALCGCARQYTITTNNGSRIAAKGKPKLSNGVYIYTDALGRRAAVPAGRVREIAPTSMVQSPESKFLPK